MVKRFCLILIIFLVDVFPFLASALETKVEEELKAKFITNYIPYTKWPSKLHESNEPIIVCVMESDLIAVYLRKINEEEENKFKIKVKEKNKNSNFSECLIFYINKYHEKDRDYYINLTRNKPILTISDIPDFSEKGGVTGFQIVPGQDVVLEINMRSVKAAGLEIDPDLLSIMKIFQ